MRRKLRVFGSAPYLGQQQEVHLDVRFGDRTCVAVEAAFEAAALIAIQADITGREARYNLVTDCLESLQAAYEAAQHEPATKLLVMTWEKALNDAWTRVLQA